MFPYLIAGAIGYGIAKLFEDETPKYADGGIIVGEYDDDNKFPSKEKAFELIQFSVESDGTYFIDEDGDGMFESEEQAYRYVEEIYDVLETFYDMKMIPVYRVVEADEVDLSPYGIGESWSMYLDSAKQFGRHLGQSKPLKIISGYVPNNNVDWKEAFVLYTYFSNLGDGDSEFELPIPSNNKIFDVRVSDFKEAKELEPYKFADGGQTPPYVSDDFQIGYDGAYENLLAPNGKISNLTPEQYKLVRSPQFKKWFGDWENDRENSGKVSGYTKEPIVFYHSTKSNFLSKKGENIFKNPPFFFSFKEDVSDYIVRIQHQNKKGRVFTKPFFLKYHNTFDLSQVKILKDKELTRLIKKHTFYQTESDIRLFELKLSLSKFRVNTWFLTENEDFQEYIKNKGYDSFVVYEDGDKNIAVFKPNQIKLADGSNTTFDGNNPDVRYADGGIIPSIDKPYKLVVKISNINQPNEIISRGIKNKYKGSYAKIFDILNENSIFNEIESVDDILVKNDLYVFFDNYFSSSDYDKIASLKNVEIFDNKEI